MLQEEDDLVLEYLKAFDPNKPCLGCGAEWIRGAIHCPECGWKEGDEIGVFPKLYISQGDTP